MYNPADIQLDSGFFVVELQLKMLLQGLLQYRKICCVHQAIVGITICASERSDLGMFLSFYEKVRSRKFCFAKTNLSYQNSMTINIYAEPIILYRYLQ